MDNYYDVQKPEEDDKVAIAVTFLKDHALQWWTSKKEQDMELVASLTWNGFKELLSERFTPEYQGVERGNELGANAACRVLQGLCEGLQCTNECYAKDG